MNYAFNHECQYDWDDGFIALNMGKEKWGKEYEYLPYPYDELRAQQELAAVDPWFTEHIANTNSDIDGF